MSAPRALRVRCWRVWLAEDGESADAERWVALAEGIDAGGAAVRRSRHAATFRRAVPGGEAYVKVYRRTGVRADLKDALRSSKARHVLGVTAALARAGFTAPRVLAAGEERRGLLVRRAWIATAPLAGEPLAERVARLRHRDRDGAVEALAEKRRLLAAVGAEVARLHRCGFVAGDLVPANVWVSGGPRDARIAFLDHDRTRAGRAPAPWWRARRNLVQLNRVVLRGVTATDRLRVYRAYARARAWPAYDARRRLAWIVAKTVERRRRFDHVRLPAGPVSFRALMRADGPYAPRRPTGAE